MNKTVSVNISGLIFNIEEEAYQLLGRYLATIRAKFHDSEEGDEILNDIESRIAELFQERISDRKEVVQLADVKEVITIMGEPDDYVEEAGQDEASAPQDGKESPRRVFRDMDQGMLGGVASGISAYFNWDPIWLRIGFVLSIFAGFGIILYIILWIIIPEAKTIADKLQMRGKAVTVENIRQKVKQQKEKFADRFEDFAEDIRNMDSNYRRSKGKYNARRGTDFAISLGSHIIRVLTKIIGILFILVAAALIVLLVSLAAGQASLFGFHPNGDSFSYTLNEVAGLVLPSPEHSTLLFAGLVLLIVIPIIALLYSGIKMLLGIKTRVPGVGIALGSLWFVGIVICVYTGIKAGSDLSTVAHVNDDFSITQPTTDTLFLDASYDPFFSDQHHRYNRDPFHLTRITDDSIHFGFPEIDVRESTTDQFEIQIIRIARGSSHKEAMDYAQNIQYRITQQDSLIYFAPFYSILRADRVRFQQLEVIVRVPKGKTIYIKPKMDRVLENVQNIQWISDEKMVGHFWTMTEDGLDCEDF